MSIKETTVPDIESERGRALRIIEALRKGSNCLEGTDTFTAGRAVLYRAADVLLDELGSSGGTAVRWLKGRYGQGKTHTLARLMEIAHARNWVSSYVQISGKGQGTELHRFEEIYATIVRNCLCQGLISADEGRVDPGRRSGWEWILDEWYQQLRIAAVGRTSGDVPSLRLRDHIDQTAAAIRRKWSIHGSFVDALRQFAYARTYNDVEWAGVMLDWFAGQNVHARGGDIRKRLREAGILEPLNRRNAKEMLRSLSVFLKYRGFGGMLILFDEVENVLQETPKARRGAYTVLRELIDNIDDRHGMDTVAFYLAGTPDLFDSENGISEYEALAERVLLSGSRRIFNPAGSLVDLEGVPLGRDDLVEISRRIAALHGSARRWKPGAATETRLGQLLKEHLETNPDATARAWVRRVVDELDSECAANEADRGR